MMKTWLLALWLGTSGLFLLSACHKKDQQAQKTGPAPKTEPVRVLTRYHENKAKAEQGDADAQFNLGNCYASGDGVGKDEREAVIWYHKAAEQRHVEAQFALGNCYASGDGVGKDEREAARWYRSAAEQGSAKAQHKLGVYFYEGRGVSKDYIEAARWFRKGADQNHSEAQNELGYCYVWGDGVPQNLTEAAKWYRKAADQNLARAQNAIAGCYIRGSGVKMDWVEAAKWYRKAAEQNFGPAQFELSVCYEDGKGVVKEPVEAYKWLLLAALQGDESSKFRLPVLEKALTPKQMAEGQMLAKEFEPRQFSTEGGGASPSGATPSQPSSSGTGFFITDDGYFITNQHVAGEGATVRLVTATGSIGAKAVKADRANDLALLKAEGRFTPLPVITSRGVRLGATAATVGFPNTGLQGFAPKLAKGEIASLAGAQDDARHFQISAPIQPGNSGGALVDERGNVIGVVVAKLSQRAALATSGALAENVNYAVKSSYLLSFLESVPEVAAKLKEAHTKDRKFEDVVKSVEQATVLVLVY